MPKVQELEDGLLGNLDWHPQDKLPKMSSIKKQKTLCLFLDQNERVL